MKCPMEILNNIFSFAHTLIKNKVVLEMCDQKNEPAVKKMLYVNKLERDKCDQVRNIATMQLR